MPALYYWFVLQDNCFYFRSKKNCIYLFNVQFFQPMIACENNKVYIYVWDSTIDRNGTTHGMKS